MIAISSYSGLTVKSLPLVALLWLVGGALQTLQAGACDLPAARAVSVQGRVEVASEDTSTWTLVQQRDVFCAGDRIRVGANSRAGLSLGDDTLLRLGENSSVRISAPQKPGSAWLDLLQGIAHFISRVRHSFQVNTPYVNASVEGTEFTVESSPDRASVTVLEGKVRATNAQGEVVIKGGERVLAKAGAEPRIETVVAPLDAVQWALYYPPLIDPAEANPAAAIQASIAAYRRGDLEGAFNALASSDEIEKQASLLVYRASLHLRVGATDAARRDLANALRLEPEQADALALMSIISTVNNQREQALDLARTAVAADPQAVAPLLALSYAKQAQFRLSEALEASRKATQVAPESALAWSRLAQLQLMFRRMDEAADAAQQAVRLAPDLPQTQTTLGFAQLIRLHLDAAQQAFDKAISLDQAAPLPRLGLGLVMIREGELSAGRRELETAANLDPGNALIRSYLGKAYYEEKRDQRAATQFELAKRFDDLDPTAWFYDAVLKQTQNRPQEALGDLRQAIKRNDNRAVYRSRLLLDEDQAARNASLAQIYEDLGFQRLALKESWKSLATDPGNASAHRFLSDSFAGVPRHEIARVSELLQTQMLAPEIVSPVSPSASEANLLAFQGGGPAQTGFNEYNPLFNRQRLSLLASGVTGGNNTRGGEIAVGGFTNRGMLSAGYFKESSDGYRENNDSEQTIKNVFGQYRISSTLSIQGEFKRKEGEYGDLLQYFDPNLFSTILRRYIDSDSSRLGVNYSPNENNKFLYSAVRQKLYDFVDENTTAVDLKADNTQHEVQYIYQGEVIDVLTGFGKADEDDEFLTKVTIVPFPGFPPITQYISSAEKYEQKSAYAYAHLSWPQGTGVIGVDYFDLKDDVSVDEKEFNPKLGLLWDISQSSRLRIAAFKTMRGLVINNQTLAPSQIAGFNQLLDDTLRAKAWNYGIALDSSLSEQFHGGIELTRRNATTFVRSGGTTNEQDHEELNHEAYLSWLILNNLSLTSRYIYQNFEREYEDGSVNLRKPAALETQTLMLQLSYHHASGLFGIFETDRVAQKISNVLPTNGTETEDDSFVISNLSVGLRLPQRRGIAEIKAYNIFDREIKYQSIHPGTGTPLTSRYYPERYVSANLQLWF